MKFLQFVDAFFPADPHVPGPELLFSPKSILCRKYVSSNEMTRRGPVSLRPWHLVYSAESGVRGFIEPEPCLLYDAFVGATVPGHSATARAVDACAGVA